MNNILNHDTTEVLRIREKTYHSDRWLMYNICLLVPLLYRYILVNVCSTLFTTLFV